MIREAGINVLYSHISMGQDFFEYQYDHFDIVISNPPFSRKLEVLERLYTFNKPFALLLGLPILNYQNVTHFLADHPIQLLCFDKKVSFDGKTSAFANAYFCRDFLPKDLIFEHLEHNNIRKHYVPSRMSNAQ